MLLANNAAAATCVENHIIDGPTCIFLSCLQNLGVLISDMLRQTKEVNPSSNFGHSISLHLMSTLNLVHSFISQSMQYLIEVVGSDPLNFRPQCHASHVGKTLLNRGNLDLWHAKFRVILGSSGKLV